MFRHTTIAAMLALSAVAVTAQTSMPGAPLGVVRSIDNSGCTPRTVFVYAIAPTTEHYYAAHDCEIVFSDHVTVFLPELIGTTPRTITVRNVGNAPITVRSPSPDVIDATVVAYSDPVNQPWLTPGTAMLCCANPYAYLSPQSAATFTAYPGALPNSWFTTSAR